MDYFVKSNSSQYPDQLEKEAMGLKLLSSAKHCLKVPKVFEVNEKHIKIERINTCPFNHRAYSLLGRGLKELHQNHSKTFGLSEDNYIGLNSQLNGAYDSWPEFFIEKRLKVQINRLADLEIKKKANSIIDNKFNNIAKIIKCERPSLVHGDLWSGNVLYDGLDVWLIDPAIYYGDPEVDIAMLELFGSPEREFYDSYAILSKDYAMKKTIYNLYHVFNHLNLFGNGYLQQCIDYLNVIDRFN